MTGVQTCALPICTYFPAENNGSDFNVATSAQNSTWSFSDEGADTYIVFPAKTIMGYVANDYCYDNPKFKVLSLTESEMILVIDNGEIAWQYIFIKEGAENNAGDPDIDIPVAYDPDSDFNIFKFCNFSFDTYYTNDWSTIFPMNAVKDGNNITISLPTASYNQWQAQIGRASCRERVWQYVWRSQVAVA